jgi:hypothetical protein
VTFDWVQHDDASLVPDRGLNEGAELARLRVVTPSELQVWYAEYRVVHVVSLQLVPVIDLPRYLVADPELGDPN